MTPETVTEAPEAARKPALFPHDYEVALSLRDDRSGLVTAAPRAAIVGGAPPQFGGRPEWWSPEHLLLSAASLCLMTTFQVFAEKEKIEVRRYSSLVKGILDKTRSGIAFTSIVLEVDLEVDPAVAEQAERLLGTAKRYCIVANALKTPVDLRVVVNA